MSRPKLIFGEMRTLNPTTNAMIYREYITTPWLILGSSSNKAEIQWLVAKKRYSTLIVANMTRVLRFKVEVRAPI